MRRQRGEKPHADGGRGWRDAPHAQGGLEPPRPGEAGGTFPEFLRALSCDFGLSCGTRHVCRPPCPRVALCCVASEDMHPLSPSSHSGSWASCSLRGASENLQRQPHPHASQCRGAGGGLGSVLLLRLCPQGWGPWPGSSLGTGAPRSQALGTPSRGVAWGVGAFAGQGQASWTWGRKSPHGARQPLALGSLLGSSGVCLVPPWPPAQRGLLGPPHPLFLL